MPVATMVPYVTVSYILWLYIACVLGDAAHAFVKSASFFFNQKMTFSVAIYALVYRQILILAHNAVIIAIVFLVFVRPLGWIALLAIPELILTTITSGLFAYLIAVICTRYRDMAQIVESILQIAFFVTPVLWMVDLLKEEFAG